MPWNNKSGGGGPWGGGTAMVAAHGGRDRRSAAEPQGSPPDLEDIIRRGQDRLKQALPGGGVRPCACSG